MKKFILLALAALLALPVTALAAINGSTHDLTVNFQALARAGACAPCHIPHGGGERLFPGSTSKGYGTVGNLCAYCHAAGGLGTAAAKLTENAVYDTNSHAGQMNVAQWPDGPADYTYLNNSGLPYVNLTTNRRMHCTSCHNVHDNTARPFLRDDLLDICGNCHPFRHYVNGTASQFGPAGNWVETNARSANPGSHPVGADVNASFLQTWSTVTVTVTAFNMPRSAVNAQWSIGGHLTGGATGGVHCVTCHTVHGRAGDPDASIATTTDHHPYTNFLEIEQLSTTLSYNTGGVPTRSVASGFGDDNAFCEACHNGTINAAYTNEVGTPVDPGRTGFTHPLDGIVPTDNNWVTAWSTWPQGNTTTFNTSATPVAICESCHVIHPQANNGPTAADVKRADVNTGADAYLLRDDTGRVCNACHLSSSGAHHPVGMTYNASGVTYLPNNAGGGAKTLLCSTCHGGGQGGAHNWSSIAAVSIATGWVPANNARDAVAANDAKALSMSQTCMDCHFGFDSNSNTRNPTQGTNRTTYVNMAGEAYSVYGAGTHWMGMDDTAAQLAADLSPTITNIYSAMGQDWPSSISGVSANASWARFGSNATGPVIVCESCHELQPLRNNASGANTGRHLLLARFTEGLNGDNPGGDTDGRDEFCEACHLPAGTHAMTGMTVARTAAVLNIDTSKAWLVTLAAASPATWTVTGSKLSCDSCHQVHDATGANMILDARAADAVDTTALLNPTTIIYVPYYPDGNKGPNQANFCNYCHAY